ncbi:hypothetical protein [Nocardia yamanashiensis]|uniref:hypothetical protein n=1 Tax=Nocardia yamanashiensis TaxID=209247 RepID=UPI001F39EF1C|nr:hypothetical protein [Nocardia yamanashiensis]
MTWRTRLASFPGGMLDLRDREGEPAATGFYLESHLPSDERTQEPEMRYKPTALGYLRTDVSGIGQLWDETCIRNLAVQLGYDFSGMLIHDPRTGRPPLARLRSQATRLGAEAVIVPSTAHFPDGQVPPELIRQLDVITVSPKATFAR